MSNKPTDRLKALFAEHSELSKDVCDELVSLYDRKLWHELSLRLRQLFQDPAYSPYIQPIFTEFIVDFGQKINLLYFAQFAHDVAKTMDRDAAVALLTKHSASIKEMQGFPTQEPLLFMEMSVAEHFIDVAHMDECKERLDKGLKQLETMSDVEPVVSAAVYNVAALHAKARQDFTGYYRASLQYLCYVSVEELPQDERIALARDISLAALLGDSIYSFAELLRHPVVGCLDGTPYAWLRELLHCFSAGDMQQFAELCTKYGAQMNSQPALVAAERRLKQKVTIMCLVALVSSLPPDQRRITLATIAARTQLDVDGVEFLLMRAMSLKLVTGTIDELESVVDIRHVQPRILTMPEIEGLKGNVEGWVTKVEGAAALLNDEGVAVIDAAA